MKDHRIVWPLFLAFINLVAAIAVFTVHMFTHLHAWPGNAALLVWLGAAAYLYAIAYAEEDQ